MPTIDANAIAADVLQQIEPRLDQSTTTPAPTVDATKITAAVLAEVESQFDQATITPAPTLDMNEITEEVLSSLGRNWRTPSSVYTSGRIRP